MTEGLDRTLPVRRVYLDALGAWSTLGPPLARLQAGARLTPSVGIFTYVQRQAQDCEAGAGARFTW